MHTTQRTGATTFVSLCTHAPHNHDEFASFPVCLWGPLSPKLQHIIYWIPIGTYVCIHTHIRMAKCGSEQELTRVHHPGFKQADFRPLVKSQPEYGGDSLCFTVQPRSRGRWCSYLRPHHTYNPQSNSDPIQEQMR